MSLFVRIPWRGHATLAAALLLMQFATFQPLWSQDGTNSNSITRLADPTSEFAVAPSQLVRDEPTGATAELGIAEDIPYSIDEQLARQRAEIDTLQRQINELKQGIATSTQLITADSLKPDASSEESGEAKEPSDKDGTSKSDAKSGTGAKASEGDWTDMSKDNWTVKLGGHVQMDLINWATADDAIIGDDNYFEFRRLRLVADGTGYGVYDFRLQMTLEPETVGDATVGVQTTPDVKDAYFSINELPWLGRARIGNFFVPFGLEQVTNDTNNLFLERSIPTQGIFTGDREVGVATYDCTENQRITWSSGIFVDNISDAVKQRVDDNQGFRLCGRLTALPYYDEPSNGRYLVHVGTGILYTNDQDGRTRFRARPQIHQGPRLIDSGIFQADQYTTGNIEAAVVLGRFTVQSEAFLSNVDRTQDAPVNIGGAYVHASWFLTGENRVFVPFGQHGAQFDRSIPYSNVFAVPGFASLGAWELKSRWSVLDLNNLGAGQYNDITTGFNWYWSERTRVMFDWIHPMTSEDTVFGAVNADILAMRFDFNW